VKALFTVWSFPGHINPAIAIAQALQRRGHEIAFSTGERARAIVAQQGMTCFPFQHVDEDKVYESVFSPQGRSLLTRADVLKDWLVGTLRDQIRDQEAALDSWAPDVIVCDVTMWGPPLFLRESRGAQVAICSFAPGCMIPSPDTPVWGMGLPSPRTWSTRLLNRGVGILTNFRVAALRREVNRLRVEFGLPMLTVAVHAYLGGAPLYLVPSIRELDYDRRDVPKSVHYIGSVVWNRPSSTPGAPEWFDNLPRDKPWVHVTEGTMHAYKPFLLQAAAEGLCDLPMEVVMTTGSKERDPEELGFGNVAANIHVRNWAPHQLLFERTDVVVTTGGAGTILTALEAGIPLVIVPTEWDKPDNAQRVVEAGAAIRIAPRRCTPRRLREAVNVLLRDPSYREQARRLGDILKSHNGPTRAAELIERSFGKRPSPLLTGVAGMD